MEQPQDNNNNEEQDGDDNEDQNLVRRLFQYDDPSSMILSEDERDWAMEIKAALRLEPEIDDRRISDMQIAQIAIVKTRQNSSIDEALDIAYKMQCFMDQYQIQDTVEDGIQSLEDFMEQQPGFLLDVSYVPVKGTFSCSSDYANLRPSRIQTPQDYRVFQKGSYYQITAAASTFRSIRAGLMTLSECDGMGYQNFNPRVFETLCHEFWAFYPCNYKETVWVNTPLAANVCYSIIKKVVSQEMAESWRVGERIYEGRLNELYNVPTPEDAKHALLSRMRTYLTTRYEHQRNFRFPTVIPDGDGDD